MAPIGLFISIFSLIHSKYTKLFYAKKYSKLPRGKPVCRQRQARLNGTGRQASEHLPAVGRFKSRLSSKNCMFADFKVIALIFFILNGRLQQLNPHIGKMFHFYR